MKTALKLAACVTVFAVSVLAGGMIIHLLHLPLASMPPSNTSQQTHLLLCLVAGALLVLGVFPLARRLTGSFPLRWIALGSFLFLALGVNTMIEVAIFGNLLGGGVAAEGVQYFVQAVFLGAAVGFFFGTAEKIAGLQHRGWVAWTGRGIVAWLGFPVIYLVFGMCVAPIVVPYYQAGVAGLHIPPISTILQTQLLRSVVFLASSLPLIALWKGSRRELWLALGLAHAVTVGIFGLTQATFMPGVLRIVHSLEITADSFAYAGLLVLLFRAGSREVASPAARNGSAQLPATSAAAFSGPLYSQPSPPQAGTQHLD
jgi:hypothetical protein